MRKHKETKYKAVLSSEGKPDAGEVIAAESYSDINEAIGIAKNSGGSGVVHVYSVNSVLLGDLLPVSLVTGLLREQMAERIGNDDGMTTEIVAAIEDAIREPLAALLDDAGITAGLRIDGNIILHIDQIKVG